MQRKITIGDKDFAVSRPKDLDEQLVAATGCSSGEIGHLTADPSRSAHALRPFLGEGAPGHVDLARLIAGDRAAIDAIRDLYASLDAAPVQEKAP